MSKSSIKSQDPIDTRWLLCRDLFYGSSCVIKKRLSADVVNREQSGRRSAVPAARPVRRQLDGGGEGEARGMGRGPRDVAHLYIRYMLGNSCLYTDYTYAFGTAINRVLHSKRGFLVLIVPFFFFICLAKMKRMAGFTGYLLFSTFECKLTDVFFIMYDDRWYSRHVIFFFTLVSNNRSYLKCCCAESGILNEEIIEEYFCSFHIE